MIGTAIGPYLVLEKLGQGGMGEVYLARDTRLNRRVALKSLSMPGLDSPASRRRLLHEAQAAAQLTHPNIAGIYDILDVEPRPCIVMEYVQGQTLARRLADGPLSPAQAVSVGIQLADALAVAHGAGVVHRDLKPSNVVLTPDGTAKILDFGIARFPEREVEAAASDAQTRATTQAVVPLVAGTPAYMAPEQLVGKPAIPATDIYGLGVLLYELLTGQRPYAGATLADMSLQAMVGPTPRVRMLVPSVLPELDELVAKAMARDPGQRHASAASLAEALRQTAALMSGDRAPMHAPPVPAETVPRREGPSRLTRPRVLAGMLALAGVAAIAVFGWRWMMLRTAPPEAVRQTVVGVLPLANLTGDPSRDYIGVGISDGLTTALAGIGTLTVKSGTLGGDAPADPGRAARSLGAAVLITGSVAQAGDALRFSVRVVKPDGTVTWAQEYEGTRAELFRLQRGAAGDIVEALHVAVSPGERARLDRNPAASVDAYVEYASGRTFLDRPDISGNLNRAIAAFERAVAKDPAFALGFAGLSQARWMKFDETSGRTWADGATQAIETAVKLDPGDPRIQLSLAGAYQKTGRLDEAAAVLNEVIRRRPNDDEPHRLLAGVRYQQDRNDDALAEHQRAIALRPDDYENHKALGVFYFRRGRYAEAAIAFQRATEVQPDNAWGFVNLGAAYQALGDNARALVNFERSLAIEPDAITYSNIGTIHYSERRFDQAVKAYSQAVRLQPGNPVNYRNLGDAYVRLGRAAEAKAQFMTCMRLATERLAVSPRDADTLSALAVYEAKAGLRAQAERHAAEATALAPDNGEVLYRRAAVHALGGQTEPAVEWLERAIRNGYSRDIARQDDDLASLRENPAAQAILRTGR